VRSKLSIFSVTFSLVMLVDIFTKRWAMARLSAGGSEHVARGLIPVTLAFNKGAAFGLHLGEDSRWFFVPVTILALILLAMLLKQSSTRDYLRILSVSLVVSGAVGNLYDRLRWSKGVVDFIGPVNLGFWDFPIFNFADAAITCGAILLALSFWLEEQRSEPPLPDASSASAADRG